MDALTSKQPEGSAFLFLMHSTSEDAPPPLHTACLGYISLGLTQMINSRRITVFMMDAAALWN